MSTMSTPNSSVVPSVSCDSAAWRQFLDSSCSSATVFLRVQLATAHSYFHSPTPWNPSSSDGVSRKVARLLDSFRPGSSSYCPFPPKQIEPDSNNNRTEQPSLLRPSEVVVGTEVTLPLDFTSSANASTSTSSSTTSSSPSSLLSREEEQRRQLYLPLGRPRPFYRLPQPEPGDLGAQEVAAGRCRRCPALSTARSLQDEVRAQLVAWYGLVRLSRLSLDRAGIALPTVVRNNLLTLPCRLGAILFIPQQWILMLGCVVWSNLFALKGSQGNTNFYSL